MTEAAPLTRPAGTPNKQECQPTGLRRLPTVPASPALLGRLSVHFRRPGIIRTVQAKEKAYA